MNMFKDFQDQIMSYFSKWIQVNDKKSGWTIEDFPYQTGVLETLTYPHCWKCVTVNQCFFKNEQGKKPEHVDYNKYSYSEIPKSEIGLYHPNCHCKEKVIENLTENNVVVELTESKIEWLYSDKFGLVESWGYSFNDKKELMKNLITATKKAYVAGRYIIRNHDKFGVNISLFIEVPSKKTPGKYYKRVSSYMIFPNGKLKNNTPIGVKWK